MRSFEVEQWGTVYMSPERRRLTSLPNTVDGMNEWADRSAHSFMDRVTVRPVVADERQPRPRAERKP